MSRNDEIIIAFVTRISDMTFESSDTRSRLISLLTEILDGVEGRSMTQSENYIEYRMKINGKLYYNRVKDSGVYPTKQITEDTLKLLMKEAQKVFKEAIK